MGRRDAETRRDGGGAGRLARSSGLGDGLGEGSKARRERCGSGSVVLGMGGDRVGDQRRYL